MYFCSRKKDAAKSMKCKWLIVLAASLAFVPAHGQGIRLTGDPTQRALYLDLDRVWSYNLYERSRWGAGLRLLCGAGSEAGLRQYDLWGGYSPHAQLLTGGVAAEWHRGPSELFASAGNSIGAAGGRNTRAASLRDLSTLSSFMTKRMNERSYVLAGYRYKVAGMTFGGEAMVYAGRRLYDGSGLLYRRDGDELPREDGWEVRLRASNPWGLTLLLQCGDVWPERRAFMRLLAEWQRSWRGEVFGGSVFAQGGIVSRGAPYTYMFDLGGTKGSPLYFERCLLTARPVEFTADLYGLATLRIELSKPLFSQWNGLFSIGSMPVPFVGINVAWGLLRGMDANGMLLHEGLALQAPYMGIVEPVAGIDGLIRWGVVDWGVAAAWRLTPVGAPYHSDGSKENLTIMITAKLTM